jgi:diguanylate cyclase (GGDEF)-like protein
MIATLSVRAGESTDRTVVRLSYVIKHDVVQAGLRNFTARTGIGLNVEAPDGHAIPPVLKPANLCLLLQNFGRCAVGQPSATPDDSGSLIRYEAGPVGHLIIPIGTGEQALGRLISEPFAVAPPDFPTFYQIARTLPVHPDNLMTAALEIPVVDPLTLQDAGKLLRAIVDHVAALSFQHQDQLTVMQAFDAVIQNLSHEVLADLLLNLGARLLRAQGGLLILAGPDGQQQESRHLAPELESQASGVGRLLQEVGSWVMESRKPISIPDLKASPWAQHILGDGVLEGCVLGTPLLQRERVAGALVLLRRSVAQDAEGDLHVMKMLAAQAVTTLVMLERLVAAQEQALTDSLTGLYNYRFFQQHLQRELSRASRSKNPLSLIILDIDNFKVVNDSYGHDTGNRVLQHLARMLERTTRRANVLVRYGGEEFCIIVPEGDLETARAIAERVCAEIRATPFGDSGAGVPPIHLTVSAGVTTYVAEGGDAQNAFSLFKRADENLLAAKKAGKDRVFAA